MRRLWIHHVLPPAFAAVPVLAAGLVIAAVPPNARSQYLQRLPDSHIDWVILSLGTLLFLTQVPLAWKALRWQQTGFDERPDKWLTQLGQAAEWFPLLGLIGTVAAILQTFSGITPGVKTEPADIIRNYAPAITATGSGLYMAFINILPGWVVTTGRELIRSLAGEPQPVIPLAPAAPDGADRTFAARGGRP